MGSETCKPQKGELGGRAQDGPRRPKTPGPIISHFGSGSCQSVRLGPPDLTTTSCKHFCSSAIMGKADLARSWSLLAKRALEDYETLKAKQEKLSSCCKELRKLRRRIIGEPFC